MLFSFFYFPFFFLLVPLALSCSLSFFLYSDLQANREESVHSLIIAVARCVFVEQGSLKEHSSSTSQLRPFSRRAPVSPNKHGFQEQLSCANTVLGKGELRNPGQTGHTKEKAIKPSGTQCNAKCEWPLRWTDPSSKGCCPLLWL